jgi:hypothetical protein
LRPRILVDVSSVDTSTTVLGSRISMPIMVSPTAHHKLAHPEGGLNLILVRILGLFWWLYHRWFQSGDCSLMKICN